jgi:myo-inositol-1(or 4)-monophosphatase
MLQPTSDLESMIAAARAAGEGLMRRFRALGTLEVRQKGPADFVSIADLEAEGTIKEILSAAYPTRGFLTEESAPILAQGAEEQTYIVDPLDGTTNFVHGVPHFAVSIALRIAGRVVLGVVFDPAKDEMFVAERGCGTWLQAGPGAAKEGGPATGPPFSQLAASDDADFARALVATGVPHRNSRQRHTRYLGMLRAAMGEAAGIRRFAAAALDLAYVAAGRFACYFERGLQAWDVAAGSLLVEEAGGRVTDLAGGTTYLESGDVLATNGRLHARALALLGSAARATATPRVVRRRRALLLPARRRPRRT